LCFSGSGLRKKIAKRQKKGGREGTETGGRKLGLSPIEGSDRRSRTAFKPSEGRYTEK